MNIEKQSSSIEDNNKSAEKEKVIQDTKAQLKDLKSEIKEDQKETPEIINKLFSNYKLKEFTDGNPKKHQQNQEKNHSKVLLENDSCVIGLKRMLDSGDLEVVMKKIDEKNKKLEDIYKIPYDVIFLAIHESKRSKNTSSPAGAVGYRQFIESSAKRYNLKVDLKKNIDERKDVEKSTNAALDHLIYNIKLIRKKAKKHKISLTYENARKWAFGLYNAFGTLKTFITTKGDRSKRNSNTEAAKYVPKIIADRKTIAKAVQAGLFDSSVTGGEDETKDPLDATKKVEITGNHIDFPYLKDSQDSMYRIFKYTIKSGGNLGAVESRFLEAYPSITHKRGKIQISDDKGKIYKKGKNGKMYKESSKNKKIEKTNWTSFPAGTTIYIRSPKDPEELKLAKTNN